VTEIVRRRLDEVQQVAEGATRFIMPKVRRQLYDSARLLFECSPAF
jgi:hypothetical protein